MGNQPGRPKIENSILNENKEVAQSTYLYNNQPFLEIHSSTST